MILQKVQPEKIEDKEYDTVLAERGFEKERIRHYGFAFEGKHVLIGSDEYRCGGIQVSVN